MYRIPFCAVISAFLIAGLFLPLSISTAWAEDTMPGQAPKVYFGEVQSNDTAVTDSKVVIVKMEGGPKPHFEPKALEIEAGTTIEWINTGTRTHTVTEENAAWDSGSLAPGEKFSKKFETRGTVAYYCVPHRDIGMTGTIIVK